jgi:demethylmenaquinone methyltransferase/2-methoxy-6-polyprenyl-1,4-benzoquinol methylase
MEADAETKRFYNRISSVYDALSDSSEHKAREKGLEMLGVRPGEQVLEIGFGTGHSLVELARMVGPDGSVFGVDISEGMLRVAANRVEKEGFEDRISLKLASIPPIPYQDGQFDAVTLSFTLELFPDRLVEEVLREIQRILRPEGRLGVVAMSVPLDGSSDGLMEKAYKWMHRHFPHIVDCRPIDANRCLETAGFSVNDQSVMSIWTMPVIALVASPS